MPSQGRKRKDESCGEAIVGVVELSVVEYVNHILWNPGLILILLKFLDLGFGADAPQNPKTRYAEIIKLQIS
jgi:hypothetical protein